jgi:hypothetical protein
LGQHTALKAMGWGIRATIDDADDIESKCTPPTRPLQKRCVRVMNNVISSEDLIGNVQAPLGDYVEEPPAGTDLVLFG